MIFDMSSVTSSNGVILKFENSTGTETNEPWRITALIDNLVLEGGTTPNDPATILSITPVGGDVMKIVVNVPGVSGKYWPQTTENLIISSWIGVAHSVDGSAPWYETNLSYVTEFESGTNEVIYVQATETEKFFKIIIE